MSSTPITRPSQEQTKARIELARRRCKDPAYGFTFFVYRVFACSFPDGFVKGDYIKNVCKRMSSEIWTMDISARDHFKSTRLYAEVMFDIFTTEKPLEAHYFSYGAGMSAYHIGKIRKLIEANPYFPASMFQDLTANSMSTIRMLNPDGAVYECKPEGLLTFKRGIHAERVYVDDPLRDPENKLAPTVIYKINNIIKTELFPMVKRGGICRVVGTPQTNSDFFFDEQLQRRFSLSRLPAIVDEAKKQAVFPEWKSYEELNDIRETIGEKTFNQEYMTKPAYAENSYIERKELYACVDDGLPQTDHYDGEYDVVAGFDIGKKAHPSHFAVFERRLDENDQYHYRQLLSKWFDGVDYKDQIAYLKVAVEDFGISALNYDNTRGEFELFAEAGELPRCMTPVVFTMKQNHAMGANLNKVIQEQRVKFINDQRQLDQLLQVNNDLQAIESPLGHGDSFWSNALALMNSGATEPHVWY